MENEKILVAAAWPYVNGDLHPGHLAGYLLPADVFARYSRLRGRDVMMVSGSDCHGTPITVEADKQGISPKEVVETNHAKVLELFNLYQLSYNLYTRTNTKVHKREVQKMFLALLKNGYIVRKSTEQYYSEEASKFLPDRYVEGTCPHCSAKEQRSDQCENCGRSLEAGEVLRPYSKLTKSPVILKETEHYFLDLTKSQKFLSSWMEKNEHWRGWVRAQTNAWLTEGLKPRSITRDLDWGIEIPVKDIPENKRIDNIEDKRIYVWFEAVIGYLSAAMEWSDFAKATSDKSDFAKPYLSAGRATSDKSVFAKAYLPSGRASEDKDSDDSIIFNSFHGQSKDYTDWWKNPDAKHYYFMGKDNLVFHTLNWPAQLHGTNEKYTLPYFPAINQFLNLRDKKFSKSRGWTIDSARIAKEYGVDAVRFYIASIFPENRDGNFTWEDFVAGNNNVLVANLGNFIHRTLTFIQTKFDGSLPSEEMNPEVFFEARDAFKDSAVLFEQVKLTEALDRIMRLAQFGNKFFNDSAVWEVVKEDKNKAAQILYNCIQIINSLRILISPFIPQASKRVSNLLGVEDMQPIVGEDFWKFNELKSFTIAKDPAPLFEKIDEEIVEVENERLGK
jgi:methionyl-tRNA synthetase